MSVAVMIALAAVTAMVALLFWVASSYRRVPPNEVLIIFGARGRRVVTNGATFVTPFLEEAKKLSLHVRTISFSQDRVTTSKGVDILVDWTAQLAIPREENALLTAATVFLGQPEQNVMEQVRATLSGNFRSVISGLTVEEVFSDREKFTSIVRSEVADEMQRLGLEIVSLVINEISDDQGYLRSLATPQIAAVRTQAAIAEAEADRHQRERVAAARLQATRAETEAETERVQAVTNARLKRADLEREAGIREAEASMARQARQAELEASLVQTEAETALARERTQSEVQQAAAERRRRELEVEELAPARARGQAVEIQAHAEASKTRVNAQAQREAAELHAQAELAAAKAHAEGEQAQFLARAAGLRAQGDAEAAALEARGLAEARAQLEMATALNAMDQATRMQTLLQEYIRNMPEVAKALAEQFGAIDRVTVLDMGGNHSHDGANPLSRLARTVPTAMTEMSALLREMTGIDLHEFLATQLKQGSEQEGSHGRHQPGIVTAEPPELATIVRIHAEQEPAGG